VKAYRRRYYGSPYTACGDLTTRYPIDESVDVTRFEHEFEVAVAAGPWRDGNTDKLSLSTDGKPFRDMNVPEWHVTRYQFWTIHFEAARQLPERRLAAFDAFCAKLAFRISDAGLSTSITTTFTHTFGILQPRAVLTRGESR